MTGSAIKTHAQCDSLEAVFMGFTEAVQAACHDMRVPLRLIEQDCVDAPVVYSGIIESVPVHVDPPSRYTAEELFAILSVMGGIGIILAFISVDIVLLLRPSR